MSGEKGNWNAVKASLNGPTGIISTFHLPPSEFWSA